MCVCICIYMYIYIYTCMVYVYPYIHTYTYMWRQERLQAPRLFNGDAGSRHAQHVRRLHGHTQAMSMCIYKTYLYMCIYVCVHIWEAAEKALPEGGRITGTPCGPAYRYTHKNLRVLFWPPCLGGSTNPWAPVPDRIRFGLSIPAGASGERSRICGSRDDIVRIRMLSHQGSIQNVGNL